MKKKIILTTIISLLLTAVAVSAQTAKPNYAGVWELDAGKSVLPDQMRIESMTLKVAQTEKELTVESATKRAPRANADGNGGAPAEGNRGGTGMGRGGGFGGNGTITYSLDGKEATNDINNGMMTGKESRKATITADGKLSLTVTRNINGEMGSLTIKTNDTWELLDEGKTLKVTRYTESPRGATTAELHFTRKSSGALTIKGAGDTANPTASNADTTPKQISGGVLNGKASSLPAPIYPPAAKAVKASGAVNVQVMIDEQGNVVSASAVSGHPLLRQAAEEAARNAKFAPTMLSGIPVRVTGVLVYNFVAQ